jgi:hypothetical protein
MLQSAFAWVNLRTKVRFGSDKNRRLKSAFHVICDSLKLSYSRFGRDGFMPKKSARAFLTNLEQPMPLHEKMYKLTRNLWRRVLLRQDCCGHHGEPGC